MPRRSDSSRRGDRRGDEMEAAPMSPRQVWSDGSTALAGRWVFVALVAACMAIPVMSAVAEAQTSATSKIIAPAIGPARKPAAKKKATPAKKKAAPAKKKAAPARKPAPKPVPPVVEQPAPIDTSHKVWTDARALADQNRYTEALAMVRSRLLRDPDNIELRWLEAGIRGWMGRPAEAVTLYELLISDHPEVAPQVRADLAAARLDAGDAAGALRDLDVRLAEAPADRDSRERRARALGQLGRLDESLAGYDSLLVQTPGDPHLMMERARILTWMGRNREAADVYQSVLTKDPGNRDARLGMAMNRNWQGRHRWRPHSSNRWPPSPIPTLRQSSSSRSRATGTANRGARRWRSIAI
jgi:tetratricopeptide (TPR) repeat protein